MMNPSETFNQFYSRFSVLSTTVDLFHKLTPELHYSLISLMPLTPETLTRFNKCSSMITSSA
jgi:hypothetical protein